MSYNPGCELLLRTLGSSSRLGLYHRSFSQFLKLEVTALTGNSVWHWLRGDLSCKGVTSPVDGVENFISGVTCSQIKTASMAVGTCLVIEHFFCIFACKELWSLYDLIETF